jgi:hypothetical protein
MHMRYVKWLSPPAKRIGDVVELINTIAGQTNLRRHARDVGVGEVREIADELLSCEGLISFHENFHTRE